MSDDSGKLAHFSQELLLAWQQLPRWHQPSATAVAEMVRRLVGGIIHLRPGGLRLEDERLKQCDALIDEQLSAALRGHDLAAQLHRPVSLSIGSKKSVAKRFLSTCNAVMAKACQVLLRSDKTVTQITMVRLPLHRRCCDRI